ncbi:hypothetical protein Tco_1245389 [Tanacetum coccineum]
MAERPNLDEDKGGKLIDPTRFRGMDADYQDVMTHGEVPLAGSIFALDIGLFSGHQKAGKSTDISIRKLEYMLLSGCCAQILCEEKLLSFISWRQKYNWLTFLRSITERALRHTTPHCLELTNVTRDSDRIYRMRSNGHTVADSIGERSKRPTTYKFKTDCSIIPVWKSVVSWSWMKVILWNAEKEYVVHQEFASILDIPSEGACVFNDKWSLDELAYGVPKDGPYQTNPPSPDDIISENPELVNESYVLYDRVMNPLTAQQERKTRKDCGTRRGRHSTSSSSAFDQPSSSHLKDDDDDDGNDEGTSRASTLSPTRFVNSLTNMKLRDEHRGGLRSIEKGLKNLWRNKKKK